MPDPRFGLLPWQFRFPHRFSQGLHDRLVEIVNHLGDDRCREITIHFRSGADAAEFAALKDDAVTQWLEDREYGDAIGEVLLRQFASGLIEDFVQFVHEALGASVRGKPVVAYALLRKALRDDLAQLEWLVADPDGFLQAFYSFTSGKFEEQTHRPEHVVPRITKLVGLLPSGVSFDPQFLYEVRFDKSAEWGFYEAWNRALHLVTSRIDENKPRRVNLVFSGEAARRDDWERIYSFLPFVLFYAVEICEVLVTYISKAPMPDWELAQLRRGIGFVLWGIARRRMTGELPVRSEKMVSGALQLPCPSCGNVYETEFELERLYIGKSVRCRTCSEPHVVSDFTKDATRS